MTIEITNKYKGGRGIYIGRPSIFGNPLRIDTPGPTGREDAVRRHRDWLATLPDTHPLIKALVKLAEQYKVTGRLELTCFCAPKPCHGDNLRDWIFNYLEKTA